MRRHRIGCLPVVKDGRIVAMVMEEDFMGIAAELLEERFGGAAVEANGGTSAAHEEAAPVEQTRRRTQ